MGVQRATGALSYHGGNLAAARRAFPNAPEPWLDLSTGINPHAYPIEALAEVDFVRLPEAADLAALEAVAAVAFARSPDEVAAAAGTQAILQALPRLVPARRVGILGFTYAEHARAWRAAGTLVEHVADLDALASFDVAVVVTPNNPDGRRTDAASLATLARRLRAKGGWLVVDEAFADEEEPAPVRRALCLRSFGKFYGLAGVRLGFLLGEPAVCAALREQAGPWAVSGPAIALGRAAYADSTWRDATLARLAGDAAALDAVLDEAGMRFVGGTRLFRLAAHPDAAGIFDRLGRAGVLARPFAAYPTWLRFGIPRSGDLGRLRAALAG